MAWSGLENSVSLGQDEIFVDLKATAHLRLADQDRSILVAGAGVLSVHGGRAVAEQHTESKNVMVTIRRTQQIKDGRIKVHVSDTCPVPPDMSFEDAAIMVYPYLSGLSILYRELGLSLDTMEPDEEVDKVPTALILGGESAIGNTLVQLLRIVLPSAELLVTCRANEEQPPQEWEEAVRPFCRRAVEMGAKYAIDGSAPELMAHLQAAIPAYGGSVKMTFDATGEFARRPEVMGLLEASGIVDCTQAAVERAEDDDRVSMANLGKIFAVYKLQVPLCSDMFVAAVA